MQLTQSFTKKKKKKKKWENDNMKWEEKISVLIQETVLIDLNLSCNASSQNWFWVRGCWGSATALKT